VLGKFFSFLPGYLSFALQVYFVSNKDLAHIVVSKLVDFLHPLAHIFEGFTLGDVVDDDDAVGTSVVTRSQRPKSFLSSRVPDLQFNVLIIHLDRLYLEVDTNGVKEILVEGVFLY
jgi:hypothetical protein